MMSTKSNALASGELAKGANQSGQAQGDYNTTDQKIASTLWTTHNGTQKKDVFLTWPEYYQWLQQLPRAKVKDQCQLIKLATFGDKRTDKYSLRHNANVLEVTGIEGDYDDGKITPEQAIEMLEAFKLRALIAPTFTSTPDTPHWRVLTPLSAPIEPEARLRYIEILNGMLGGALASESKVLSQSYYIGVPEGAAYSVLHTFDDPEEGYALDELGDMGGLDEIRQPLKTKKQKEREAGGDIGQLPSGSYSVFDEKRFNDWVEDVCSGAEVHPALIRIAGHCVAKGYSDDVIKTLFIGLADRVEAKRGRERAELLRGKELDDAIASARAKDWAPETYDSLMTQARAMSKETAPAEIEVVAKKSADLTAVEQELVLKAVRESTGVNLSNLRDLVKVEKRERKKKLLTATAKGLEPMAPELFPDVSFNEETGMLKVVATLPNIAAMLDHYGIKVRYDVISKKTQVVVPGMQGSPDNADNSALTRVISLAKLNEIPAEMVPAYVEAIADERQVNPVADWIFSRPWDGVDRLPAICRTLEIAPDYPEPLRDVLVTRWLVSAVAAALKPIGFKARGVLTLQGPQSIGKTSWLQSLVPDLHLRERLVKTDHLLDPSNKDSVLGAVSHWLVELGELDGSFRKADVSRIKGFITADMDKIRRPYARLEAEYQRRTVFFASVNDAHFLVDETGNTRFWTIGVNRVNYNHKIDMQQLWAQVAVLFQTGEQWWLTPDEERHVEQVNKGHRVGSPVGELIVTRLNFDAPKERWQKISATDLLILLGFDKPTQAQRRDAGAALRDLFGDPVSKPKNVSHWLVPPRRGYDDWVS